MLSKAVRKAAFHQYYAQYEAHANTLAATLSGSNERDIYAARVRGYPTAVEAALFADNVPLAVYDQLIAAVSIFTAGVTMAVVRAEWIDEGVEGGGFAAKPSEHERHPPR